MPTHHHIGYSLRRDPINALCGAFHKARDVKRGGVPGSLPCRGAESHKFLPSTKDRVVTIASKGFIQKTHINAKFAQLIFSVVWTQHPGRVWK